MNLYLIDNNQIAVTHSRVDNSEWEEGETEHAVKKARLKYLVHLFGSTAYYKYNNF